MMILGVDGQNKICSVGTVTTGLSSTTVDDATFADKNPLLFKIQTGVNWQKITPAVLVQSWAVGKSYALGNIVAYGIGLWEVVQTHTSQSDWTPDKVPALFKSTVAAGVIPAWKQPTGAQDAYALGALVTFNGKTYKSLIAANVWSPTAYPAGWQVQS